MYSNYLLNPNFERTNVSALEGKKKLFSIYFKGFQCSAGFFFNEVVKGSENQHISRTSRLRK